MIGRSYRALSLLLFRHLGCLFRSEIVVGLFLGWIPQIDLEYVVLPSGCQFQPNSSAMVRPICGQDFWTKPAPGIWGAGFESRERGSLSELSPSFLCFLWW